MSRLRFKGDTLNVGSTADIAFLLLVFFLVTTTISQDWGIQRVLSPDMPETITTPEHKRNVLVVLLNGKDELMVEGKLESIESLREIAREFIANPTKSVDLPAFEKKEIPLLGTVDVSKQIVSIQCDDASTYKTYVLIQNELAGAYHELRNDLAQEKFGTTYDELVDRGQADKAKAIRAVIPMRISEANPYMAENR